MPDERHDPNRLARTNDASAPGLVVALALLGLLIGSLGLVFKPIAMIDVLMATSASNGATTQPATFPATLPTTPTPARPGWPLLTVALAGVATSGLLLGSSLGAIRLRGWGRRGMLIYAAVAATLVVVQFGLGARASAAAGRGVESRAIVASAALLVYPAAVAFAFGRRRWRGAGDAGGVG